MSSILKIIPFAALAASGFVARSVARLHLLQRSDDPRFRVPGAAHSFFQTIFGIGRIQEPRLNPAALVFQCVIAGGHFGDWVRCTRGSEP